ncbi:hypothetical protein [Kitasatospora indigofera]|uniref:hypothetical protein n=1 Tax=Kitasatospora indigofera TaxID=67307 RepID=UPI0036A2CD86
MTPHLARAVALAVIAYRDQHGDRSKWEPYEHKGLKRLLKRVAAEAEAQEKAEKAEGVATS